MYNSISNYKDGRQKSITILKDDDNQYQLNGNTNDEESIELYNTLKNQVLSKIKS